MACEAQNQNKFSQSRSVYSEYFNLYVQQPFLRVAANPGGMHKQEQARCSVRMPEI
ncbi:hypothetical protein V461_06405 [Pantoea ananatis BRT98]|nr:hypothetical protein V461_06405 [Pantoea ananatis BRT98]